MHASKQSEQTADFGARVVGVILAGGQSRRMDGREKALLPLGGRSMIDRVIERMAPQVRALAINANGDAGRFAPFGLPVLADPLPGHQGPLAGVLVGLDWAAEQQADWLVTVPGDTPFPPRDLVAGLLEHVRTDTEVVFAESDGRIHPVIALWSSGCGARLRDAVLAENVRRVGLARTLFESASASWPADPVDPFLNLNTPDDLAEAERILLRYPTL